MDGAPVDSPSIHPQLRQRMLNRATTFAEGARPSTPPTAAPRRRSSLVSDLSDSRYSLRSSSDNLLRAGGKNDMGRHASPDEPSRWIALPVVAAVVPAIIGLTVENGADVATDVLILVLAGWFLHWSVKVPWDWYHEAQQRRYLNDDTDDATYDDTIHEEEEDAPEVAEEQAGETQDSKVNTTADAPVSRAQKEAREALKRSEMLAFIGCFLGPLLGALLMHTIRGQLMRAEGIVSDANLSIFLLIAEIPPVNRLIKMRTERILHLQRIVREAPREPVRSADTQQLSQRIAELEGRLDGPPPANNNEVDVEKLSAEVRQTTQLQLDALNRAVRRYEKRHMAQSLQIEARFQDLEARLGDTLALAAAAARTGQRPGVIAMTLSWIAGTISYMLQMTWDIAMYPFRTAAVAVSVAKSLFVRDERQAKRRVKGGQSNGHTGMSTSRMQAKPVR
ncbi:uncharacterized protein J4E88_006214 [Alternaria novae-zelandiae]|uniref:uncharacterized protein n=1 Tax=Alternaria novae-zelandiae TaxID=430562 RepID=UPI0020C531C5|nr:uncharacterized protein J4E88_006214 [Alternaria novae-zelandiae]KAI4678926.1 hypothetical protein J4E88_006214 [Alternaria novae-zelandiae]